MSKITALFAALFTCLVLAPAAGAASLAYIGSDGNVWLTSPDGKLSKQLTTNATDDNKYRSPSQLDDGRVAAIRRTDGSTSFAFFLRGSDGAVLTSWLMPKSGSGGFAPFTGAQASPDGGGIVYDYRHFDCGTFPCEGNQRVGFLSGPGQTNPCLVNCHVGYVSPRWLPGTPYAGMIDQSLGAVYVQKQGSAGPVGWYTYGNGITIGSFDVRAGKIADTATANGTEYMVIQSMNGPAPILPTTNCSVNLPGTNSRVRLSPDGSMVAWTAPDGVYVSPTPTQTGGVATVCQLSPKLVAAGGSQPDWGVKDLPKPNDPNDPDNPNDPKDPNDPDNPKDRTAPQGSVSVKSPPKLGSALKQGVPAGFTCSEGCRATVNASVGKAIAKRYGLGSKATVVATGAGSVGKAGQASLKLRFTAKAKRKLANAKRVPLALELTLTDDAGNDRVVKGAVTLRR